LATEITRLARAPGRGRWRRAPDRDPALAPAFDLAFDPGRRQWAARALAAGLGCWLLAASPVLAELSRDDLRELEEQLSLLGFDPGPVDGVADAQTATAIKAYQSFAALRVDGVASEALLEELRGVTQTLALTGGRAGEGDGRGDDRGDGGDAAPPRQNAEATPPAVSETPPEPAPSSEPATTASAARAGDPEGLAVHLASFRQEAKAHEEWRRLQRQLPNLFSDMAPAVLEIDLGAEGLFYRLYARPFPNRATAQDFCLTIGLEGYSCRVAGGEAPQVAVAPEMAEAVEAPVAAVPPAEAAAPADETVSDQTVPDQSAPGETAPDETASDAPTAQVGVVATTADDAAQQTADAAAAPSQPVAPAPALAAPDPGAAVGAPTALVGADQAGQAGQAGEPATRVGMEVGVGGPSSDAKGAPTVLIVARRFAQPEASEDAAPRPGSSLTAGRWSEVAVLTDDPGPAAATPAPAEAPPAAPPPEPAAEPAAEAAADAAASETGGNDFALAAAALRAGDCPTALRRYERALETVGLSDRALAIIYNNRGRCLYRLGRYDEALDDFGRAIAVDRGFAAAYYNRGRVHTAMGESSRARADLATAYGLGFGRLDAQP
jgi:peptidoglycan hydrolase-like protein with peptidoglycan-binding domain